MTIDIISLLYRADEATTRHEGQPWTPMRPADVDAMASTIRKLQGRVAELEQTQLLCAHCQAALDFDLCAHLKQPHIDKPLAAAAAVNVRKHIKETAQ